MYSTEFDPGIPDDAPLHEGATVDREGHRAGTPATLVQNIDDSINSFNDTISRLQKQPYHIRRLISQYAISPSFAAVIAEALGMGGAL